MTNPLVKQGNSFCVRIPNTTVKQINANEGELVAIRIQKLNLEFTPGVLEEYLKLWKNHKALRKFSKEKMITLSTLVFYEGKKALEANDNKSMQTKEEGEKMMNVLKTNRQEIKKDFGEKIYKEYLQFVKIIGEIMCKNNK